MKKIALAIAGLALVGGGIVGAAAPASAAVGGGVTIQKLCEYEKNGQCVGWYPNTDTCRNIAHHGTKAQIAACLAWSGYGSRG